mmetsp:Transcript_15736/g.42992  ORF Transcript_15736/g.42992 Transcript_15736/m.42992 type:complete len:258 (-) Transcript_15736:91-864(-)
MQEASACKPNYMMGKKRSKHRRWLAHCQILLLGVSVMMDHWPQSKRAAEGHGRRKPYRSDINTFPRSGQAWAKIGAPSGTSTHQGDPLLPFVSWRHRWARAIFNSMDRNGDGKLDLMEVYAAVLLFIAKVNDTPLSISPPMFETLSNCFAHADTNRDGLLDFDECEGVLWLTILGVGCNLIIRTSTKLIAAPVLAVCLIHGATKIWPNQIHTLTDKHKLFVIFCTILLCIFLLPVLNNILSQYLLIAFERVTHAPKH